MARYKTIATDPKLLAVDLARQLLPGTIEHAVNYLLDHAVDLSSFDARFRNDTTGAPAYPPALLLKVVLVAYAHGIVSSRGIARACATTGKTTGTVLATCVDYNYNTTYHAGFVWLHCAQKANYTSDQGDSSAPVFRPYQANDQYTPAIAGVNSASDGTHRYFMPISRIDMVFGGEFYYW